MNVLKTIFIFIIVSLFFTVSVHAQSEWNWQDSGYEPTNIWFLDYDFLNNSYLVTNKKQVSSISDWRLIFNDDNLPKFRTPLSLGLREDSDPPYVNRAYTTPPSLGIMRPGDFPTSFVAEPTNIGDWVHREYTYTYGQDKEFKILMSRLTPAILLTSNAESLRLLDGKKQGIQAPGSSWQDVQGAEYIGNPSYFAIPTSSGVQIRTPTAAGDIDLSGMNKKWLLMWFGESTYLWGTNRVIFPARGPGDSDMYNPSKQLYPVDIPVLVVMEKLPQSLHVDPNGGVEIGFGSGAQVGQVAVMPLLGANHPAATETEAWASGLPASIEAKCNQWYDRLGQYPLSVTETYEVDPETYDVLISDTFTYRSLGHGSPFAPIPPALALAEQEGFPISFTQAVVDSDMSLSIGPLKGIENATSFSYRISGLAKYAYGQRLVSSTPSEPTRLSEQLRRELSAIVNAGHLAPWWPQLGKRALFEEMATWSMPWETLYYLGQTLQVLAPPISTDITAYLNNERESYPPESYHRTLHWLTTVQSIPHDVGARRESHHVDTTLQPDEITNAYNRMKMRSTMTLYSLAEFYAETNDTSDLETRWDAIQGVLRPYVQHSDWSTLTTTPHVHHTLSNGNREDILRSGIAETNRTVAGAIGFTRLANLKGDQEGSAFGLYLLNKTLVSRFAQEKLVKYLYETQLQTIPQDPNWLVNTSLSMTGETGYAILWRKDWRSYADDVRRPLRYDQFGVLLSASVTKSQMLLPYTNLTPELARFLHDFALPEATEWYEAVEENSPLWYKAYADNFLGRERPFSIPQNAYQTFLVKAWILDETPENLEQFIDIPWVSLGDYYYIHKLSETIKAYRGWTWSDESGITPTPTTQPSKPGDTDNDGDVDISDLSTLLATFGSTGSGLSADFDQDQDVDISDLSTLLANFGS